ncbi:hypothetical protein A5797_002567 [Enterococcus faecalis]|nr:aminoglycoside 6-adenylyltransferase [Enterococcus faecalis]OTP41344.1 hypothetical protein A5797_002567 [Enterococcus faecalis]
MRSEKEMMDLVLSLAEQDERIRIAVSYTHLDVYKRQPRDSLYYIFNSVFWLK